MRPAHGLHPTDRSAQSPQSAGKSRQTAGWQAFVAFPSRPVADPLPSLHILQPTNRHSQEPPDRCNRHVDLSCLLSARTGLSSARTPGRGCRASLPILPCQRTGTHRHIACGLCVPWVAPASDLPDQMTCRCCRRPTDVSPTACREPVCRTTTGTDRVAYPAIAGPGCRLQELAGHLPQRSLHPAACRQ